MDHSFKILVADGFGTVIFVANRVKDSEKKFKLSLSIYLSQIVAYDFPLNGLVDSTLLKKSVPDSLGFFQLDK